MMVTGYMAHPPPKHHSHKCPFSGRPRLCRGCSEPWREFRFCTNRCRTDPYFADCPEKAAGRLATPEPAGLPSAVTPRATYKRTRRQPQRGGPAVDTVPAGGFETNRRRH